MLKISRESQLGIVSSQILTMLMTKHTLFVIRMNFLESQNILDKDKGPVLEV